MTCVCNSLWRRISEAFSVKLSEKYRQNLVVYEVYISIGLKKSYRSSSSYYPHAVAHLCNRFIRVFVVLISMPRFKSNNLDQTRPKVKLLPYCKNIAKSSNAGSFVPKPPMASGGWGFCLHTKKHNPPVANFWLCTWLGVSTKNANALHQNFSSITSTKE